MTSAQETTEWDDILCKFGIKQTKRSDQQEVQEKAIEAKLEGTEDDEFNFDEEDEAVFRRFREQRFNELQVHLNRPTFGEIRDIAGPDFVQEVNKAGDGIWVVLHLYKAGIPLCSLINNHLGNLAQKFRQTKFLKSISNLCIANFPDEQLPAIFVYQNGQCRKQLIGPNVFGGMNLKEDELEWMLGKTGAVQTDLDENPRDHWKSTKSSHTFVANDSDSDDGYN